MAFFDIVLHTSGSLHPHGEPDDFIAEYNGLIRCIRDRDGKVFRVGKVKAYVRVRPITSLTGRVG